MSFDLKVIHPAFSRAGSASLAQALVILGFGNTWHVVLNSWRQNKKGLQYWIKNIQNKIDDNTIKPCDMDGWLDTINCKTVMDAPTAGAWHIFVKFYPNAKVIVTIRDYNDMHKSQKTLFNHTFLAWWYDAIICKISAEMRWLKHTFAKNQFKKAGWTLNEFMESDSLKFKEQCDNKLELIIKLVPKQRLLLYKITDGWEPLCTFLNVPIPNTPFPHKNKSASTKLLLWRQLCENYNIYSAVFIIVIAVFVFVFGFSC